jgi:hypothetical protein
MPTASSTMTSWLSRITTFAKTVVTIDTATHNVMSGQRCSEVGGSMSSSTSRSTPPPTPVRTAIVAMPNRSKPLRIPTTAPEAASTAVPA